MELVNKIIMAIALLAMLALGCRLLLDPIVAALMLRVWSWRARRRRGS